MNGHGTGTGATPPTLQPIRVPVLGNSSFGFRVIDAPSNAPIDHLLGTNPTNQPILGF